MHRKHLKRVVFPALVFVVAAVGNYLHDRAVATSSASPSPSVQATSTVAVTSTNAFVVRVVDGDTIDVKIDGQSAQATIRLLGVNTPETVDPRRPVQCFGHEASAFTKQQLEGKRIKLEADLEADDIDKYNRLLRNVVMEDGTDFNAMLVREGYAYAYTDFPMNKYRKTFLKQLQDMAEKNQAGLWSPTTCAGQK